MLAEAFDEHRDNERTCSRDVGLSPSGKALDFDSSIRRFESPMSHACKKVEVLIIQHFRFFYFYNCLSTVEYNCLHTLFSDV